MHTHSYTFSGSCTHKGIPSAGRGGSCTHIAIPSVGRDGSCTHTAIPSVVRAHTQLYLQQAGLDVLIIHELREDVEFLPQELVCKVDLRGCRTHGVMVYLHYVSVM